MAILFEVTITHKAYVLAETEADAMGMQSEIERWEDYPEIEATPWSGGTLNGWDDDCLVYQDSDKDISLGEAKKMVAPNLNIIERLLEDALHHDDVATQCDCRPEDTVNHVHAVNAREAAKEIGRLRETLSDIASGEIGINLCIKYAKSALTPNV